MPIKRCVCGRSATFPVCDGSHVSDAWRCDSAAEVDTCVIAGGHLLSVAERLAHALGAAAAHRLPAMPARVRRLLVLTDGNDLDAILAQAGQVDAQIRRALIVDAPASVALAFPGWAVVQVRPASPIELWSALRRAVKADARPIPRRAPRAFVSHAVADEARLEAPLGALRRRGVPIFLCADSIPAGAVWHQRILDQLAQADRLIYVLSAASATSSFCAFELGYATARALPVRIVAIDDVAVPAFVQHRQAISVPRLVRRRPWLTPAEALLEALWMALDDDEDERETAEG